MTQSWEVYINQDQINGENLKKRKDYEHGLRFDESCVESKPAKITPAGVGNKPGNITSAVWQLLKGNGGVCSQQLPDLVDDSGMDSGAQMSPEIQAQLMLMATIKNTQDDSFICQMMQGSSSGIRHVDGMSQMAPGPSASEDELRCAQTGTEGESTTETEGDMGTVPGKGGLMTVAVAGACQKLEQMPHRLPNVARGKFAGANTPFPKKVEGYLHSYLSRGLAACRRDHHSMKELLTVLYEEQLAALVSPAQASTTATKIESYDALRQAFATNAIGETSDHALLDIKEELGDVVHQTRPGSKRVKNVFTGQSLDSPLATFGSTDDLIDLGELL